MVEITYQIVLSTLQTIALIVGITYYLIIMRNSQRAQQLQLETRQSQALTSMMQWQTSKEAWRDHVEWSKMDWEDYDDFEDKYGSDVNPEHYILRQIKVGYYNRIGLLIKYGVIDKNFAYDMGGTDYIQQWNKYGEIVKIQRELYDIPNYGIHWEYLYDEMVKIAKQKGHDTTVKYHISYTDEIKQKMT